MTERRYSRTNLQKLSNGELQEAYSDVSSEKWAATPLAAAMAAGGILTPNLFARISLLTAGVALAIRAEIAHSRVRKIEEEVERRRAT